MSEASLTQAANLPSGGGLSPTAPQERVVLLDVLRGFAIFGILLFNMSFFSAPLYLQMAGMEWGSGTGDRATELLIRFFIQGKFYSLFSFLFGLGFAVQMLRAEAKGVRFGPLYRRRLLALLLIGLVHAYLIWMGDILTIYALLGFLLFLFRSRKPKTLLVWAVILLLVPVLLTAGMVAGQASFGSPEDFAILVQNSMKAYSEGSFSEIMAQRAGDAFFVTIGGLFGGPGIFAMFLLGAYFGRQQLFQDTASRLLLFRRIWLWGLGLGLVGNLIFTISMEYADPTSPSIWMLVGMLGFAFGAPGLCFFYISSFVLLWQNTTWQRRLSPLAAVGRMALSNYLFQSIVCTTIFYSYGLGLYGQVGPALGVGLAVVIYAIQIPLSRWWLGRFKFGPAEWVWRSLTYGQFQPMRVRKAVALEA
ncbi:MAG: DUF418 domain-containing protein [Terriglobia bacterium]